MTPRAEVTTTVISCQQRHQARAETIPQLERVGLTPTVVLSPCDESQPAGGRGNALAASQAREAALEAGGDWLFCEDDIDLAPDFPRYLELAQRAGRITYFYLHDVPHRMSRRYGLALTSAILAGQPITAGLYELGTNENLTSSQCVYIPQRLVGRLPFATLAAGERPFDVWLSRVMSAEGITPLVALPHPVQHRQVRVARAQPDVKAPDKHSRSFALERRWPE